MRKNIEIYEYWSVFVYARNLRNIWDTTNVEFDYIQVYFKKTKDKKNLKNRFQEDDPDVPYDTESVKIIKYPKNLLVYDRKITKKIYILKDRTKYIVKIENN